MGWGSGAGNGLGAVIDVDVEGPTAGEVVVFRSMMRGSADEVARCRRWEERSCRFVCAEVLSACVNSVVKSEEKWVTRMMSGTGGGGFSGGVDRGESDF